MRSLWRRLFGPRKAKAAISQEALNGIAEALLQLRKAQSAFARRDLKTLVEMADAIQPGFSSSVMAEPDPPKVREYRGELGIGYDRDDGHVGLKIPDADGTGAMLLRLTPDAARSLAASLGRAADKAEAN